MSQVTGVVWQVEKGEVSEAIQYRVTMLGTSDYNAVFPLAYLSDCISTLSAIQVAELDVLVRGTYFQGWKNSQVFHNDVTLSYRDGVGAEMLFYVEYLSDLITTLIAFRTAEGGLPAEDWDSSDPPHTISSEEIDEIFAELVSLPGSEVSGELSAIYARYVYIVTGSEVRPGPAGGTVLWIGGTTRPPAMTQKDVWFKAGPGGPVVPVAPTIATSALNTLTVNAPFSQQLSANGDTPITWTVTSGALPTGMVLSSSGLLSGTPISAGAYNFTVTASNAAGAATQAYTGSVTASAVAPTIVTTSLDPMNQGSAFSQTLSASGTTPITYAIASGTIPGGLTLSSAGVLSGTPSGAGAYNFTVRATNSGGFDDQAFSGTISASSIAPTITTTALNTLTVGTVFSQTLSATGTVPLTWTLSSGSLPAGILLTSNTGVLSGTPTTAGAYNFTITATNSAGSDQQLYTGAVVSAAVAPTITTATLNTLSQNTAFSQTLSATGTTPITWGIISGGIPGIALNTSSGTLSGTPTATGAYSLTVRATNIQGFNDKTYTGNVGAAVVVTHTVFGSSTPSGGTITSHNDGGAWFSHTFYLAPASPAKNWYCHGGRIFIPAGSMLIGQSGHLAVTRQSIALMGGLQVGSGSVTIAFDENKTPIGPLVEGWNEVTWNFPAIPFNTDGTKTDGMMIGAKIGNYYLFSNNYLTSAIQAQDGSAMYLSETGGQPSEAVRCRYSGNTTSSRFYGLDIIVKETP
jgi:PKD repeat protein